MAGFSVRMEMPAKIDSLSMAWQQLLWTRSHGSLAAIIEPGSQTEQAPLSAILWLHPTDMHGFRFLTISVAPRQTVLGRPPPPASMGVGQFFNPDEGRIEVSPQSVIPMI
nr:putative GPI inositol-deacylase PGAP1-like, Alpha/Beta hydrolase fold protein [Ipomoea batatas]